MNLKRLQPPYVSNVLCQSAKAGHWETEKAGCGRADLSPKNVSQKTCSDVASSVRFAHRSDRFVQAPKCLAQKKRVPRGFVCFACTNCAVTEKRCCGYFHVENAAAFLFAAARRDRKKHGRSAGCKTYNERILTK